MPRSGLATTTVAPATAAPEGSFTVPVIDPVWAQPAAQNIRTSDIPNSRREDFMVNPTLIFCAALDRAGSIGFAVLPKFRGLMRWFRRSFPRGLRPEAGVIKSYE